MNALIACWLIMIFAICFRNISICSGFYKSSGADPYLYTYHSQIFQLVRVEASHANAHARAIAFFSYIWFKYDILSPHCCKLGGVVVIILCSQPSALGFESRLGCACAIQYAGTWKEMHCTKLSFFASKPCVTVRVGAAIPS